MRGSQTEGRKNLANTRRFRRNRGLSNWEAATFLVMVGGYFFLGISLYEPVWARWKIQSVLHESMKDAPTLKGSVDDIKLKLLKRLNVNGVNIIKKKDLKVEKTDKVVRLTVEKAMMQPVAFNIDARVNINEVIEAKLPRN